MNVVEISNTLAGTYMKRHHCDKYTKPALDLDIGKGYVLCTAEHCSLRSRKPKLYGDIKSRYPKITAAMEKLLYYFKWTNLINGPQIQHEYPRTEQIVCCTF